MERNLILPLVPTIAGALNDVQTVLPESVRSAVLVSVTAAFQAAGGIENRAIELRWFDKDQNLKGIAEAIDIQAPSTTVEYVWGLTGTAYVGGLSNTQHVPFAMVAQGGDVIQLRDITASSTSDVFQSPIAFFRGVVDVMGVWEVRDGVR